MCVCVFVLGFRALRVYGLGFRVRDSRLMKQWLCQSSLQRSRRFFLWPTAKAASVLKQGKTPHLQTLKPKPTKP